MSFVYSPFFDDIFLFFFPAGPSSRHRTHRVPPMIMVITVGQHTHTHTRSSLNVKGDDSNQNQTVFFFYIFFFSFFRPWTFFFFFFTSSHMALAWLSLSSVRVFTLFGVVVVVFLLLYWPRQPEKGKKKLTTSLKFIFHYIYPVPGINTKLRTSKNRLSSHALSSLH